MKKISVGMIAIAVLAGSASSGWADSREKTPEASSASRSEPTRNDGADGDKAPLLPLVKVTSIHLLPDHRTIVVTFNKKIDVQAAIQNKSIAFFVTPALFPIELKGVLFAGLTSSPAFSDTVAFTLDASEKEVHIHATGSGFVSAPYTLKVYGPDSKDPSKAIKGEDGTQMPFEFERIFICGTGEDTYPVTYVDDCKVL